MDEFLKSATLMFVLLNPFLMSIYLIDLIETLDRNRFSRILVRGGLISCGVFVALAWIGDAIFTDVLQVRFASFLVFGGIVFLVIALRFVFIGSETLQALRGGDPEYLEGSIAMPFMIGPGTVGASVLAGSRLDPGTAALSIVLALALSVTTIVAFKAVHDWVRQRNERLVKRYLDITGRIMALVIGTFAVEMIVQGIETWMQTP